MKFVNMSASRVPEKVLSNEENTSIWRNGYDEGHKDGYIERGSDMFADGYREGHSNAFIDARTEIVEKIIKKLELMRNDSPAIGQIMSIDEINDFVKSL